VPADNRVSGQSPTIRLALASSNPGKLREYVELAWPSLDVQLLPNFREVRAFDESAPTFAENAVGKALHYSQHTSELVLADDSGLVVPSLGGAPGVHSARYAGPNASDSDRWAKLLGALEGKSGDERRAHFVCVIALAQKGRAIIIASDRADGMITREARGSHGFGYDPLFLFPELSRTYAELSPQEKNQYSHRGKAFRKILTLLHELVDQPEQPGVQGRIPPL
jgi:XTP/dITP diphosphohydrolase